MSPVAFTSSDLNKIKWKFEGKAYVLLILVLPLVIHRRPHKREGDCDLGAEIGRRVSSCQEENPSKAEQKETVRYRTEFSVAGMLPKEG